MYEEISLSLSLKEEEMKTLRATSPVGDGYY